MAHMMLRKSYIHTLFNIGTSILNNISIQLVLEIHWSRSLSANLHKGSIQLKLYNIQAVINPLYIAFFPSDHQKVDKSAVFIIYSWSIVNQDNQKWTPEQSIFCRTTAIHLQAKMKNSISSIVTIWKQILYKT